MRKLLLLIGLFLLVNAWQQSHYVINCTVYEKDEDGAIVCEDATGNLWAFDTKDSDTYKVGAAVRLYMYTNNTDNNIYDDVICWTTLN